MLNNEDLILMNQLMTSNADFNKIISRMQEENRQILSRFTHELRNPLTLLNSTIQLIDSQHPEAREFKYWKELTNDIADTINLLNQLSTYNHCDELMLNEVNLDHTISTIVESFKPYIIEKNVDLALTFDADTKKKIISYSCDQLKLKQVLMNILKNAYEAATDNSTIHVTVSTKSHNKLASDEQFISIEITNSGTPIPNEQLSIIFEPFVTFKTNGTGLGLAVSEKIIHQHKGFIEIAQTNSTTTFSILLPLAESEAPSLSIAL